MKISTHLFFIGVILTPFYFSQSGGIQLSDIFFFSSLLFLITSKKNYLIFNATKLFSSIKYLKFFVFWTFIINIIIYINWLQTNTLLSSIYYIYNYLVLLLVIANYRLGGKSFLVKIYYSFFISLLLVFLVGILNLDYLFSNNDTLRRTVTFNNPNQLGYWALMIMTIILILNNILSSEKIKYFKILFISSILMTTYLTIISLSKAAVISIIFLIIFNSIKNIKILFFLTLTLITLYSYVELQEDNIFSAVSDRIADIGQASDDNLEGRNYDRIWKYKEYLIFGAGEGAILERFEKDNEIHSTFGTIFFSYGIIGLLSFLILILQYIKTNKYSFITFLVPVFLYGITHMGLRSKVFWIILILVMINNNIRKKYFNV